MGDLLESRRRLAATRLTELQKQLVESNGIAKDRACVYATGSFGRGEASSYSDLDLFIVGLGTAKARTFPRLDEICLKADLIAKTRALQIPEFSGDGEYLVHYTVDELITTLGKSEDDAANTFTARLLLLLESHPLVEPDVYKQAVSDVIAEYWRDYQEHSSDFVPAFLANDILRLWRTFCVNYEARTAKEPLEKRAKRRLKNYKLKHSRLLTCYSALGYLLAIYRLKKTVAPADALNMVKLTPTARLEWLSGQPELAGANTTVVRLLERYENFLEVTDASEADLIGQFSISARSREFSNQEYVFGDLMFQLLQNLGADSRLYRLLVV